jgi:phosphate-selective porin OprO and OprP
VALRRAAVASLVALAAFAAPALAQEQDEPALAELREAVTHPWLTLGALLVTNVDVGLEDAPTNASIRAARLRLGGTLDGGFSYFLQTNFASSVSLLDLRVGWSPSPALTVYAGRFKAPYSREILAYLGDLDFILRSRVVDELAPFRQIGLQASGRVGEHAALTVGGFTGGENQPRNESLVGVARLEGVAIPVGDGALSVAVQAAVGRDGAIAGRAYPVTFEGEGVLFGADARFELGRLLLAGEYHRADWDPLGAATTDSDGWFATAGWTAVPGHQALARWDRYRAPDATASDYLVVGYNFWPSSAVQLLANWWAPLDGGSEPHRVLVSFELRF